MTAPILQPDVHANIDCAERKHAHASFSVSEHRVSGDFLFGLSLACPSLIQWARLRAGGMSPFAAPRRQNPIFESNAPATLTIKRRWDRAKFMYSLARTSPVGQHSIPETLSRLPGAIPDFLSAPHPRRGTRVQGTLPPPPRSFAALKNSQKRQPAARTLSWRV